MPIAADKHARDLDAEIETLKLTIAKLQHERFGPSSERSRLLDQLELQLGELLEHVAQADAAAEIAAAQSQTSQHHKPPRRKPARRPLPDHLPRERIVLPSPTACPCCGGKLRKLGEDVTETLERVPARWKVIRHVREKMTCRACEAIAQPPAPSHPIARGRAGPQLLASKCTQPECGASRCRSPSSAPHGARLPCGLHRMLTPLDGAGQEPAKEYDHIDIPPIRPITTRIELFRASCPWCRARVTAGAPADMPEGPPFGPNITSIVTYLHGRQMVGYKRLTEVCEGLFGLQLTSCRQPGTRLLIRIKAGVRRIGRKPSVALPAPCG